MTGREQDALAHLCHVNDWTPHQAWAHVDAAAAKWQRRSAHLWELDLSMLTDAGISVTAPPAAAERAAQAAAALGAQQPGPHEPGRPDGSTPRAGRHSDAVEPGVTVRAVSWEEAATSDDPMARLLRGQSPFPPG